MEYSKKLFEKIIDSKSIIAFLILFAPLILAILIIIGGTSLGISRFTSTIIAGIFYPYIQILFWIYWILYSVDKLVKQNCIESKFIEKYEKIFHRSKIIVLIIILGLVFNSILPRFIEYPQMISNIVLILSYILMIVQLYLFYSLIYGFWLITKTLNDIYEKNGIKNKTSIIIFFFMPFTFGIIHRKIKKELNI